MSFRATAIAVAVLVVLGGIVWFTEFRDKGGTDTAAAPDKQELEVFKFEDRDTRMLEVARGDQRAQVRKDDDGSWTVQPGGEPGDRVRISSVLTRLASLRATRRVADEATDLAQYGLDAPSLITTVTQTDGSTYVLQVGGKPPAGTTSAYVKRSTDQAVFVVPNQLVTDMERLVTEPPIQPPTPTPAPTLPPAPASPPAAPTPGG